MEPSPSEKKRQKVMIIWVAIIVGIIIVSAIVLYYYNPSKAEAPAQSWLDDSEGDVMLNAGTEYLGMIDMTHVELEVNDGVLKLTIDLSEPIPEYLDDGEYAQWMATLILEDEIEKAYEVYIEMNSTVNQGEPLGYFRELGDEKAEPCTIEIEWNSLIIYAQLDGLQSAKEIQWFVQTWFEKWSDFDLLINGLDRAPNEDLQRTILSD